MRIYTKKMEENARTNAFQAKKITIHILMRKIFKGCVSGMPPIIGIPSIYKKITNFLFKMDLCVCLSSLKMSPCFNNTPDLQVYR